MNRIIITVIFSMVLFACNNAGTNNEETTKTETAGTKLDELAWLLGSWEIEMPDGRFSETWEKVNDTLYRGAGTLYTLEGKVVMTEDISLVLAGDKLVYIPSISNQNNGEETKFTETSYTGKEVVFENLQHDFPQRIVYQKQTDSTMLAYIEGEINGEVKREEYPYTRKK